MPSRTNTTNNMKTKTTTTAPVDENDPAFEFLGVPRSSWGPLVLKAWNAEKNAAAAETALAAIEDTLAARRDEIAKAKEATTAAEEEEGFARNRLKAARAKVEDAANREELEAAKNGVAGAETEAETATATAKELRQHLAALENSLAYLAGEVERRRMNARNARIAADNAKGNATTNELPTIRATLARAEEARNAERVLEERIKARRHLVHLSCASCKFWEPGARNSGTCHARPPSGTSWPIVGAADWCGFAELITPSSN